MNNIYILDACAVIALIKKEEGWQPVFEVMKKSIFGEATVFMRDPYLFEDCYVLRNKLGIKDSALLDLAEVDITCKTIYDISVSPVIACSSPVLYAKTDC